MAQAQPSPSSPPQPSSEPRSDRTEYNDARAGFIDYVIEATGIQKATIARTIEVQYWTDNINLANATEAQLSTYVAKVIADIRHTKPGGEEDALGMFMESFLEWEESHFAQIDRAYKGQLLSTLRTMGITYAGRHNTRQSVKLFEIANGQNTRKVYEEPYGASTSQGYGANPTTLNQKGKGPLHQPDDEANPIVEQTQNSPENLYPRLKPEGPYLQAPLPIWQSQVPNRTVSPLNPSTNVPPYYYQQPAPPQDYRATTQPGDIPQEYRTTAQASIPPQSYRATTQPQFTSHFSDNLETRQNYQTSATPPRPRSTTHNPAFDLVETLPPEKIVQFQKAWRKENNYSGKPYDLLTDKVRIFSDLCRRLGIKESQYQDIFPDILEGRASTHYIYNIGPGLPWRVLYDKLNVHFNTNVNHNQYWTDWTTLSFARCKQENPDKDLHAVLEIMIDKITLAQRALGPSFAGEVQLHTAVVRACRGQPELEQALFSLKPTCEALFSDLRSAIQITADRQAFQFTQDHESYYTDRRYIPTNKNGYQRNHAKPKQGKPTRTFVPRLGGPSQQAAREGKRCFVCHKEGCWSSNHPRTDQTRAKRQYMTVYEDLNSEKPSHDTVQAYITSFEGDEMPQEDNSSESDSPHGWKEEDDQDNERTIQFLTVSSFLHRATGEDIYSMKDKGQAQQFLLDDRYGHTYQGELWDTGAARVSTVGKAQAFAYIQEYPRTKIDWTPNTTSISFGGQNPSGSVGTVRIENPLGTITYHILDAPTPFLLSLADADRLGAYFNNVSNVIVRKDGTTIPVVRKWGHPFFNLSKDEVSLFFNENEMRRLHRRFGHPRTERLYTLLRTAGHDVDHRALEEIEKFCHHCQSHGKAPQRFKFSIQDNLSFNYEIVIDIVHINKRNVLHVIDTDTSFQAAIFLKSMSARDTWEALCKCWINVYQGPPDRIIHDPGTNFTAEDFQARAKIVGTQCQQMPVEAHWAVGRIERAHGPLRRVFDILRAELQQSVDDEDILQMAVKAINDTAGPHGLVPTLLVFGAYPRINKDSPPSPDIIARGLAVRKAKAMLHAERAKDKVNKALNSRNGVTPRDVLNLPLKSEILVWRENKGWTGPYELQAVKGQDVVIETENGPVTFRATSAKPYYRTEATVPPPEQVSEKEKELDELAPAIHKAPVVRRRGRPRKNQKDMPKEVFLTQKEKDDFELALKLRAEGVITTPGKPFEEADRTEMEALLSNGTFKILQYDPTVHKGRIFNMRIVREVKGKSTQPYEKSRLVFAGHSDQGKEEILTQSPTIQRMSQRLLLALAASLRVSHDMHLELRDITQAYVQSKDKLSRTLYARPPKELKAFFPPGTILQIVRPLYGAAESGLYWFKTYHDHHVEKLEMETSTYDPCLLITYDGCEVFGMTGLQTDDTLSVVTPLFSQKEEVELGKAKFRAKPKTILTPQEPIEFNGGRIKLVRDQIWLMQKGQAKNLAEIDYKSKDAAQQYVEQRARGAYISSVCQPEAAFDLSVAAQTTEPSKEEIKVLNARTTWQRDNPDRGLTFIPLDLHRAKLFIFTDGSFANNKDMSSQIGFVIVLATESRTGTNEDFTIYGNIVHWNSTKCKRVTRSVLASELYGMVGGFDSAIALSTTIAKVTSTLTLPPIPLVVCTDSKSLYDCLVKLGTTSEKRLMIDIMSLRQSYEAREISEVRWINGKDNPADACTKRTPNTALARLVSDNKLTIQVEALVQRLL